MTHPPSPTQFRCVSFRCVYVCVYGGGSVPLEAREGVGYSRTGFTNQLWTIFLCCWGPDLCPLEKQVLLITGPSLQPLGGNLLNGQLSWIKIHSTCSSTLHFLSKFPLSSLPPQPSFLPNLICLKEQNQTKPNHGVHPKGVGPAGAWAGITSLKKTESFSPNFYQLSAATWMYENFRQARTTTTWDESAKMFPTLEDWELLEKIPGLGTKPFSSFWWPGPHPWILLDPPFSITLCLEPDGLAIIIETQ